MRTFVHVRKALAILLALSVPIALLAIPASASDRETIADTAIAVSSLDGFDQNGEDFDILIQALIAADLVDALRDPHADLTAFAPTDQAFVRLARDLGFSAAGYDEAGAFAHVVKELKAIGGGDPIPVLRDVLLYHVSPGSTHYGSLRGQVTEVPTLLGISITAQGRFLTDAAPAIEDPRINNGLTDIEAANGVIHGINRVLLPIPLEVVRTPTLDTSLPNIVETAILVSGDDGFDGINDDFDILIQAVIAADLVGALADNEADLTLFAPTDQAFVRLARDLGFEQPGYDEAAAFAYLVDSLTLIGDGDPIPVLRDVLLYHVSPGSTLYGSLRGQVTNVPTLLGGVTFVAQDRVLADVSPEFEDPEIKVGMRDIQVENGVIHGINRVLLPFGS